LDVPFHTEGVNWLCDVQQPVNFINSGWGKGVIRGDSGLVWKPNKQGGN
jgi:hypothetical protein